MYAWYEVYECPSAPSDSGRYIGATPVKEQAFSAAERHNAEIRHRAKTGKFWFVKGVLHSGERVTFL